MLIWTSALQKSKLEHLRSISFFAIFPHKVKSLLSTCSCFGLLLSRISHDLSCLIVASVGQTFSTFFRTVFHFEKMKASLDKPQALPDSREAGHSQLNSSLFRTVPLTRSASPILTRAGTMISLLQGERCATMGSGFKGCSKAPRDEAAQGSRRGAIHFFLHSLSMLVLGCPKFTNCWLKIIPSCITMRSAP